MAFSLAFDSYVISGFVTFNPGTQNFSFLTVSPSTLLERLSFEKQPKIKMIALIESGDAEALQVKEKTFRKRVVLVAAVAASVLFACGMIASSSVRTGSMMGGNTEAETMFLFSRSLGDKGASPPAPAPAPAPAPTGKGKSKSKSKGSDAFLFSRSLGDKGTSPTPPAPAPAPAPTPTGKGKSKSKSKGTDAFFVQEADYGEDAGEYEDNVDEEE